MSFYFENDVSTLLLKQLLAGASASLGVIRLQRMGTMNSVYLKIRRWLSVLWAASPPLAFAGLIMVCDLGACLVAMAFDSRQITGINAWIKPAKFGLSSAITCWTLAWIARYLGDRPRIRNWSARVFAVSIAIEIIVIDLQAARGTTSHFNMAGSINRAAFITMGISIAALWFSMVSMTYALMRQHIQPASWAWALRLGLLLSVVGAAGGGFMLRQTPEQKQNPNLQQFGAHTVGAPDGGPGIPLLNWSENHGDLRVAHFLGLHAVQIIPLLAWWLLRKQRLTEVQRTRLIWLASGAYILVFTLLAWQALRGQALMQPNRETLFMASILVLLAGTGCWAVLSLPPYSALKKWVATLEVHS